MSYNGWTNKETWLVNLWLGDNLAEMTEQGKEMDGRYVEAYVSEFIPNIGCPFTSDMLACAMGAVNWDEIADSYQIG